MTVTAIKKGQLLFNGQPLTLGEHQFEMTFQGVPMTSKEQPFWILWCPDSDKPPTRKFTTLAEAQRVAESMIHRLDIKTMYVLKVVAVMESTKAPVKVTVIGAKKVRKAKGRRHKPLPLDRISRNKKTKRKAAKRG